MKKIISVNNMTKIYKMYNKPSDRLKEAFSIKRKSYHRDFFALKNVSFDLYQGDILGIIGENGAGKSTLLKVLTGIITPNSGVFNVEGKIAALLELGAGFNPEYSGIENINLQGTLLGYSANEMKMKIPDILDFAELGDFINQPVKSYSSGMYVRLAFSIAINVDPDILIVDEALAVGDLRFQIKCMNKFKNFIDRGKTIIFVSHDINAVKRFCTKCLWLENGVARDYGDCELISQAYENYLLYEKNNGTSDCNMNKSIDSNNRIATVNSIKLCDSSGFETTVIKRTDDISVIIDYNVYEEKIDQPVVGVSIRNENDDYMCGLNTLLDNFIVPWRKGENSIRLTYKNIGLNNGKYYIDVAIFEQTATVPIQYLNKIVKFEITTSYKGEGIYIIPHEWVEQK